MTRLKVSGQPLSHPSALTVRDDRFWGHLGLRLPGDAQPKWYAVTDAAAQNVRRVLADGRNGLGWEWVLTETLDNSLLAWRPKQMQRILLLDDGSDYPKDDSNSGIQWDAGCGMPMEVYAAMADWADEQEGAEKVEHSAATQCEALSAIGLAGFLTRPEELRAALRHTKVHFLDGSTTAYEANQQDLTSIWFDFEDDATPDFVEISAADGGFESFYPTNELRLIEIPLVELEEGKREWRAQFEGLEAVGVETELQACQVR